MLNELMVSVWLPELVRVTDCGALLVWRTVVGNVSFVADSVTIGPAVTPVPETEMDCGLPGALSVMLRLAASGAASVGVKVRVMVQLAWGARLLLLHVSVSAKSEALVPLKRKTGGVRSTLPVLVKVTVWGELVVPICWFPKFTLESERLTFGLGAIFVRNASYSPCDEPWNAPAVVGKLVESV